MINHQSDDWKPFSTLYGFIRLILLVDWDPIGVFGLPGALDQYDRYMDDIYKIVVEHGSKYDVIRYLVQVQTERIGMHVRHDVLENVVDKIFNVVDAVALHQSLMTKND